MQWDLHKEWQSSGQHHQLNGICCHGLLHVSAIAMSCLHTSCDATYRNDLIAFLTSHNCHQLSFSLSPSVFLSLSLSISLSSFLHLFLSHSLFLSFFRSFFLSLFVSMSLTFFITPSTDHCHTMHTLNHLSLSAALYMQCHLVCVNAHISYAGGCLGARPAVQEHRRD